MWALVPKPARPCFCSNTLRAYNDSENTVRHKVSDGGGLVAIAYLGLGGNLGDAANSIRTAAGLLASDGRVRVSSRSSFYRTDPVGYEDQPEFTNAVIEIETTLTAEELLGLCLRIEQNLGRQRTIRWGPRVIDIDILIYDNLEMNTPGLTIPHPRMMERGFVMAPLAEIAPDLTMPDGRTADEVYVGLGPSGVRVADDMSWED